MQLQVAAGQVAVPSQNSTGSTLCTSDANEYVTLPAAPGSGTNRIDLIICRPRGADLDGGTNNDWIWDSVQGTVAASPTVPATPAGTTTVAQVYVPGGAAAIVAGNITDVRPWGLSVGGAPALPPPVTTGTTVQSFTDQNGEVWVAKNGVNAGAWKKARDVLHCWYHVTGSITLQTTDTLITHNAMDSDPYGLYNPATGVMTTPVAGKYRLLHAVGTAATAVGQTLTPKLFVNGSWRFQRWIGAASATSFVYSVDGTTGLAVNDTVSAYATFPVGALVRNDGTSLFQASYVGTG